MTSTMQLEFSQAMSDFKTMFPDMDRDVIEAVLRANQGAVDATIDQLLAMSTDNQNERLRNELENSGNTSPTQTGTSDSKEPGKKVLEKADKSNLLLHSSPQSTGITNTGASPKIKKDSQVPESSPTKAETVSKWKPPMLGPLPVGFLRLSSTEVARGEYDLPDEQFALMLQNEEFMNELRWNQEFMNTLEKEQQEKGRTEDDAAFKERLKHMGKVSRKKFLQMARVFTWQRNKKTTSARHIDSLPLKEEPSDDEELCVKK